VQLPWVDAVPRFVERMQQQGLRVIRTFDLHETRIAENACTCPNHGTEPCDCQLVVMLVYGKESPPASLVAHGYNGQTWFSLVEFLGAANACLESQIRSVFGTGGNLLAADEFHQS
jgi:hypothetical protein